MRHCRIADEDTLIVVVVVEVVVAGNAADTAESQIQALEVEAEEAPGTNAVSAAYAAEADKRK